MSRRRTSVWSLPTLVLTFIVGMAQTALAQVGPPSTRFDATPVKIMVPDSGTSGGFYSSAMGDKKKHWALIDVTGDGMPDLIQTADPKTGNAFGAEVKLPRWRVCVNDGGAMKENTKSMWTLPDSGTEGGFSTIVAGKTVRQWALLFVRNTTWPDLVQAQDPATGKVFDAGSPPSPQGYWGYWKLFNIESMQKFNKKPGSIRLRPAGKDKGFNTLGAASGTDRWVMFDIDGNGMLDLVQTLDPATGKVWVKGGKKYWQVFRGADAGGSSMEMGMYGATPWALPESGLADGFTDVARSEGAKRWMIFDLDADKRPDLVQSADPKTGKVWGAGTGKPYWKLFKGTESGFAAAAVNWPVPDSGTSSGFMSVVSGGAQNWVTIDLDADGKVDLVQTSQNDGKVWGAGSKKHYWKLFKNTGSGFATSATEFAVPEMGLDVGFFAIAQGVNTKQWVVVDIDGDRRLDLVQTADPTTGGVWGGSAPVATSSDESGGAGLPTSAHAATPKRVDLSKSKLKLNTAPSALSKAGVSGQTWWVAYLGKP